MARVTAESRPPESKATAVVLDRELFEEVLQ